MSYDFPGFISILLEVDARQVKESSANGIFIKTYYPFQSRLGVNGEAMA